MRPWLTSRERDTDHDKLTTLILLVCDPVVGLHVKAPARFAWQPLQNHIKLNENTSVDCYHKVGHSLIRMIINIFVRYITNSGNHAFLMSAITICRLKQFGPYDYIPHLMTSLTLISGINFRNPFVWASILIPLWNSPTAYNKFLKISFCSPLKQYSRHRAKHKIKSSLKCVLLKIPA